MNNDDNNVSFDEFNEQECSNELSEEDLAILRAFDALESIDVEDSPATPSSTAIQPDAEGDEDAEMLMIFLEEAEEDISRMRQAMDQIRQLEPDAPLKASRFQLFQRAGHKLRGTCGAVGYTAMATIAQHIERISEQITQGVISPYQGRDALMQALTVLEYLLHHLVQEGSEPDASGFITDLEQYYLSLNIDLKQPLPAQYPAELAKELAVQNILVSSGLEDANTFLIQNTELSSATSSSSIQAAQTTQTAPIYINHINRHSFEQLLQHTEQLIDLHTPIADAQRSLSNALHDLQAAQIRLQQLEQSLSYAILHEEKSKTSDAKQSPEVRTSSSLIARILASSEVHHKLNQPENHQAASARHALEAGTRTPEKWDELDIEHYSEKDLHLQSLREAIVEMAHYSSRALLAQTALQMAQQEYEEKVTLVRHDVQAIRLTSLSTLIPRLQQVINTSTLAKKYDITFEVSGEQIEIDYAILEVITPPLLMMFNTCMADSGTQETPERQQHRVWLNASKISNTVTIEIGFSMPVQGGAIDTMSETLRFLHGTIHFPRTTEDGIRFVLRFPASHGPTPCLIVRIGDQRLLVMLHQVQRVSALEYEPIQQTYHLRHLLRFPGTSTSSTSTNAKTGSEQQAFHPLLILDHPITHETLGIIVDEIEGEREMVIKSLKSYLERPGIVGSAVDGHNNILLALDLPTLLQLSVQSTVEPSSSTIPTGPLTETDHMSGRKPCILLADDSAYLRQTIRKMLPQHLYEIVEARDGREALEQLLENTPDICLLDIEMPNLSGFDLLNVMKDYPELARVKTIMLTSRTSEKHRQRALELGAMEYLTKPCDQEVLLSTIARLLNQDTKTNGIQRVYIVR
jgi:chemotaxis protein histidine kinase CheA/ActR/RegA family two-component response regulator